MVLKCLLSINLLMIVCTNSMAQTWQWAVKLPSGAYVYDMAVDNSGYAYIGGNNSTIHKYSPKGNLVWVKKGASTSFSKGLAFDEDNNLYVAGHGYNDEWDGQKTNHIFPASGLCLFVMKLDTGGKLLWSTTIPNKGSFAAFRIVADKNGATYIHGGSGNYTTFVTKLNPDGTQAWYKGLSGANYYSGTGDIGLDAAGNCYVTSAYGTNWYPKSSVIAKFDNNGNQLWKKTIEESTVQGIAVQPNGDFIIADNRGFGFTAKYDGSGNRIWNGNKKIMQGYGVITDKQDNIYVTGSNVDPVQNLSYPVIAKWNSSGADVWNIDLPGTGNAYGKVIRSTRIDSSCYVAGTFITSVTLGQTQLQSSSQAVFFGKLNCNFAITPLPKIVSKLYPNPFAQSATLNFDYIENEVYTLKIFDSYGQWVKSIENITNGSVTIQRDNMAAGVYFYLLSSQSNKSEAARFIIH